MAAGQWFQVDLKGTAEVSQVNLTSKNGDRAYGYEVYVYGSNYSATGIGRGIIPQVSTGKAASAIQFYSITGRRIDRRNMHASGAGVYLSKALSNGMSIVKPKVVVR